MATSTSQRQLLALVCLGLAIQAMLLSFVLLYVNVPSGFTVPYGLNPHAVELFRAAWPYPEFSLTPTRFTLLARVVLAGLWAAYLTAVMMVLRWQRAATRSGWQVVIVFAFTCLFNASIGLLLPPVLSGDIYHYALYGRMVAIYGLNPYALTGNAISSDPFWSIALWRDATTHYGPVWTLLAAGATRVGAPSVFGTVLALKGLAAVADLAAALLVFVLARRFTGDGLATLLLYAWNPLLIIESAGGGHNDSVMIAIALAGVLLVADERVLLGVAVLVASALVKYVTALLVVFSIAAWLARETSRRRQVIMAFRAVTVMIAVIVVAYAPFLHGVARPGQLLAGLALSVNPMPNPFGSVVRSGITDIRAYWEGAQTAVSVPGYIAVATYTMFVVLVVFLVRRLLRGRASWPRALGYFSSTSLVYAFVLFGGSFPWYLICPLTSSLLAPPTRAFVRLRACVIGFGVGLMYGYTTLIHS